MEFDKPNKDTNKGIYGFSLNYKKIEVSIYRIK